jgi:hypothetical protein
MWAKASSLSISEIPSNPGFPFFLLNKPNKVSILQRAAEKLG